MDEDWNEESEELEDDYDDKDAEEQDSETEDYSATSPLKKFSNIPEVKNIENLLHDLEKENRRFQLWNQNYDAIVHMIKNDLENICKSYENKLKNEKLIAQEKNNRINALEKEIEDLNKIPEELKKKIKDLERERDERKRQVGEIIEEYSGYSQEKYEELKEQPEKHGSGMRVNDFTVAKFLVDNGKLTFTQICNGTGMNPKIVNDCRKSLLLLGFIKKNEDGSYEATQAGKEAVLNFQGKI
jgi:predicted ribosome quality control (RQC) complex YloA/Tae2 family protein